MGATITLKRKEEIPDGWEFFVEIEDKKGKTEHEVILPQVYWAIVTICHVPPEELVRHSIEFLLAREPKESIKKVFYLYEIKIYFPEYEKEMKKFFNIN